MSLTNAVASRVKLATLSTGRPRFTRMNKRETKELAVRHNTDAGKVTVASCDDARLTQIDQLYAEAREIHNRLTRPTIDGLCRLLPAGLEFRHSEAMRELRGKIEEMRENFLFAYDALAAEAPQKLNGLYDPSVWKSKEAIAAKFDFTTRYLPCPTEGEWGAWLEDSVQAAQQELMDQLTSAIRRVAERCASQGPLYQTVFSNLNELLALVPGLDLTADPKIRELMHQAKTLVHDKDLLVRAPAQRKAVAEEANRLASMFGRLS